MSATWDPQQYARYADHRSRPFFDLVGRVQAADPGRIIDLGCGPGELTATLRRRWPAAAVVGIDNSPTMLERAQAHTDDQLSFAAGDLTDFRPGPSYDVVLSNAAYQWVDGHPAILREIAADLPRGGWLAVQVPGNFTGPSHNEIRSLVAEPKWQAALDGLTLPADAVLQPTEYGDLMAAEGLAADTWETTYNQVLDGTDPVLEWVKGTALVPVLTRLRAQDPALEPVFLDALALRLRAAYPRRGYGTVFPFRRIFAVGHR